jgi:phosphoglycolate phosphatase
MKLLLFDLDGTLVTTGGAGLRALDRAFLSLARLPRATEGISFAGRTDPFIIKEIFRLKLRRAPHPKELQDIFAYYLAALEAELHSPDDYKVMEGVAPLLDLLAGRTDVFLALGTGNLEGGARLKLEPAGLNKYFPVGGFGSDAEDRPEVLKAGVLRSSSRAGRPFAGADVVVIGDTIHDVSAGKAIGAVTVAVSNGHASPEELRAAGPDLLLSSLRDPSSFLSLLS